MTSVAPHSPVMMQEVLKFLQPRDGGIYLDGTFGAGGYSRAILESANCKVVALDRDPDVQAFAEQLKREYHGRFVFIAGRFSEMVALLASEGIESVDGIVLDIGVSSMQLDRGERGFSFMHDARLDMRMEQQGITAGELINTASESELADLFYLYGEERASRRIARAVLHARAIEPIESTARLADIVKGAIGKGGKDKIHPATRTFQALRIAVNDELGELERALEAALTLLAPGGHMVVVSFHSLEDRIVKQFFKSRSGEAPGRSRHLPQTVLANAPIFSLQTRKAVTPTTAETDANPRARSAKLRAVTKLA